MESEIAEVSIEKPNDIYRIFMVGGSTTYSVLVPDDQTIPVLTQKLMVLTIPELY